MDKNRIEYSLSNVDIERYVGRGHIIKYSDLSNFDNIDDVFNGNSFVIVLIESKPFAGHWCCMLRYDNTIELFDSYSGTLDNELNYISKQMKIELGENEHILTELLKKSGHKIVVNKYKFQSEKKINGMDVDSCGKHVLLRILMFVCGGMDLKQYTNWFKTNAKLLNLRNDEFVCKCITF